METSVNIKDILSQVKKLNKEDQLNVVQKILGFVKKTEVSKKNALANLSSLSGLGNEVWKDTNIDSYIERERKW